MKRRQADFLRRKVLLILLTAIGLMLFPMLWLFLKEVLHVSDRYLPSIRSVIFDAAFDIEPNVLFHLAVTASRLIVGFVLGVAVGITLGLLIFRFKALSIISMPSIQATRSVPAIAIVPFFLLWFGFSEWGRYLLVVAGTAFNILVAVLQILDESPAKYEIMFHSFGVKRESRLITFALPVVCERLLPTLRFALSTGIGLIVVSELLGSQTGLGYLIQTSRATFSLHVIFLSTILLGLLNVTVDWLLRYIWSKITYWR